MNVVRFHRIKEHTDVNTRLRAEVSMLTNSVNELKSLNTCLRDEHTALQLAFASLEDKLRKVQVCVCLMDKYHMHRIESTANPIYFHFRARIVS